MARQLAGRLSMALFAAALTIATAILVPEEPGTLYYVPLVLSILCMIAAAGMWTMLLWWYFVNIGKPLKISAVLKFFRRGR